MSRLAGKRVLITGGGSGLGRETALLFSNEGAVVALADISLDRARAVEQEVTKAGGEAIAIEADVKLESEVSRAVQETIDRFGGLDVAFANAGIVVQGRGETPVDLLSAEAWDEVIATNLSGVFFVIKHAARVMKPQRAGNIIVTSSAASWVAYPRMAAYSASKAGVNGLVKALSLELGEFGIRINAVCPTHGMSPNFMLPIDAPVIGKSYEETAGPWEPAASPIPLKLSRPPGLRDNANAVLFLASEDSAYMSGVCLPTTDGGTLSKVAMQFEEDWIENATRSS